MRYLNRYIVYFISILITSGCVVYYPHTPDIPSVSEKNELIVDGGISLIPAIEGTINYGISDKMAIQAYGNLDGDYRYLLQVALGFYKSNESGNIKSLYFGFGHGIAEYSQKSNYTVSESYQYTRGNYQIYYMQPNYIFRSKKFHALEAGFGIKTGIINTHLYFINDFIQLKNYFNDYSVFFEPTISLKLGGDRFRVNLKTSWCYLKTISRNYDISFWPYGNIGLSLNYRFKK